ncbi:TOBE domain-containing protein [Paenibacillus protaetiae]|uniref:TOBE domain-containing protein n=1 Tax=Paenibacillus protaetiae TaxID=2509456 RepID=UPI003CC63198
MIERVGITSIFVTHDQDEAIEVADEIMIISKGQLEQKGTPWDIYKNPETPFVASFIGESAIVEDVAKLRGFEHTAGDGIKALVRPEYIEVGKPGEIRLASAAMDGIVKHVHFRGSEWLVELEANGVKLMTYRSLESEVLHPNEPVSILLHRAYLFNDHKSWVEENRLKEDPMPIYI